MSNLIQIEDAFYRSEDIIFINVSRDNDGNAVKIAVYFNYPVPKSKRWGYKNNTGALNFLREGEEPDEGMTYYRVVSNNKENTQAILRRLGLE